MVSQNFTSSRLTRLFAGSALVALLSTNGLAFANFIDSGEMAKSPSALEETRIILDKASSIAQQGALAVQRLQSISVDDMTSQLVKDYMASMVYIPQAVTLPSDRQVVDESWDESMVDPRSYKNGDDEPVDAKALDLSDNISNKVLKFLRPVQNAFISSPFGLRWGRPHQGIDMAAPTGTPIVSAEAGKVIYSGWKQGYGNFVAVDHGHGFETHYAHCSKMLVHVGQSVKKGQLIAKVGNTGRSTGPHLHFEVVANGIHQNPTKYLNNTLTVVDAH